MRVYARLFYVAGALVGVLALGCGGGDNSKADGGGGQGGGKAGAGAAGKGGAAGAGAVGGGAAGAAGGMAGGAGAGATGGNSKDGGATDGPGLDLGGIAPPASLTVTVKDRRATLFELVWTAPSVNGQPATAYQVRYAKVPITSTNFNDTTVTTAVGYTGTPKAPGMTDGMTVKLLIETSYYFAVQGTNSTGGGSIDATTTAIAAHFLTTVLTGATGDRLGRDVDGSGDFGKPAGASFTNDGLSDLLVGGQGANMHAFLFLASSTGYASTPSVTFTGSVAQFGSAIANVGDVDGDGLDDIAISSRGDGLGKVFIFSRKNPPTSWGTTGGWPAALTDTQANYVITATAPLTANSMDLRNLARLGNFDSAGSDDFAITFDGANGTTGAVFIAKGSSSFASFNLPSATAAIEIDGAAAGSAFGATAIGLGPFFSGAGPGLLTTALLTNTVYAFEGQSPAAPITAASANDSAVSATSTDRYGNTLGLMGLIGTSPDAVTVGALGGKYVDVYFGNNATGPIVGAAGGPPQPNIHLTDGASGNSFGVINIGGAVKGTGQTLSLVGGDTVPDLVVAGLSETGLPIYILDGASLANLSGTVDVSSSTAAIKVSGVIPSDWVTYSVGTLIPDSNGDGVPDFAVGEDPGSAGAGRVVIFY